MKDEEFLVAAAIATAFLNHTSVVDYWSSALPSPADTKISQACILYMNASPTQREVFCSDLGQEATFNLDAFADRMAMLSVRQQSEDVLLSGLVALVINLDWPGSRDVRDILMTLSIVYHSATKLGCAEPLFQQAVRYCYKPTSREVIMGYLQRTMANKTIEIMGWQEIDGPSGLIYQFGKQPIPDGFL